MYRAMPLGESSPVMSFSRRLSSSRDPAYPPDSSDHNASRSRPERSASTVASPSAMIVAETTSWLQALATSPAPSGPSRTGVPQAIAPGYFATELTKALVADEQFSQWVRGRTPAGRWGDTQDLVGALLFLASGASDFVNGQTLFVDGGMTAVV